MLDVNRRVMSAIGAHVPARGPATPSLRLLEQVGRAACEPSRGGVSVSSGREDVGQAAEPRLPALVRVGVAARRTARSDSRRRAGSSDSASARPSGCGREVRALRVDLVAVLLELELAQDRRRHEADDVRERGHLEVGAPRLSR